MDFDPQLVYAASDHNILHEAMSYFSMTKSLCKEETFFCEMPNKNTFMWFGILTSILLFIKLANRLLCIGFIFGLPGLFGRNLLLYASEITNTNSEKVFQIESSSISASVQ